MVGPRGDGDQVLPGGVDDDEGHAGGPVDRGEVPDVDALSGECGPGAVAEVVGPDGAHEHHRRAEPCRGDGLVAPLPAVMAGHVAAGDRLPGPGETWHTDHEVDVDRPDDDDTTAGRPAGRVRGGVQWEWVHGPIVAGCARRRGVRSRPAPRCSLASRIPEVSMLARFLARLIGVAILASIGAGIASALAAIGYKRQAPPLPAPDDDEIDFAVVMEGAKLQSTASAFCGGRLICWYGGADLDLREATFDPRGATLEVRTVFGGTRVVVAPGVPVSVSGPAFFGGAMNATDAPVPTVETPGLEISGFTLFGGLQVTAAERGEDLPGWTGEEPGREDAHGEAATSVPEPEAPVPA